MTASATKRPGILRLSGSGPVSPARISGHVTGKLVELRDGAAYVNYPGNPHGTLLAASTLAHEVLLHAHAHECAVLLVFERERSNQPIIVGVLSEPSTPQSQSRLLRVPEKPDPTTVDALVDGRRVVLEAADEIILRCGEASITLRRNGRVIVRGTHVETRSRGVNRIRGGSVQIN